MNVIINTLFVVTEHLNLCQTPRLFCCSGSEPLDFYP